MKYLPHCKYSTYPEHLGRKSIQNIDTYIPKLHDVTSPEDCNHNVHCHKNSNVKSELNLKPETDFSAYPEQNGYYGYKLV
jgi:hypothetical protein